MAGPSYKFTVSLNVLNHLGISLYSNVPAVLAEAVANAWDADAEMVNITLDVEGDEITLTDDGHGMSRLDMNRKYLMVGYQRREKKDGRLTPRLGRPVMGRKGIGKLSLFSIASLIEVHSVKGRQKNGFVIDVKAVKKAIKKEKAKQTTYKPKPVLAKHIKIEKGTKIILRSLSNRLSRTAPALRKRLARRFSVIGPAHNFEITVNGDPITIADREYFPKVQCLWAYGPESETIKGHCTKHEYYEARSETVGGTELKISGWIGTTKEVTALRDGDDSLNRIVIVVRGKVAQEDILEPLGLTGMFTKYVFGEIHADFLDRDDEADIATSSRQAIVEDDPRYTALKTYLKAELGQVRLQWNRFREKRGSEEAQQIPAIKEWLGALPPDSRRRAEALFGKINQFPLENDSQKRTLLKHAVLAFESFSYKHDLDALEGLTAEDVGALMLPIFKSLDDIEATLYRQIVNERVAVIRTLRDKIDQNAREKIVQQHLFDHLWLLDPSWERATGTEYMEQEVQKEFAKIDAALTTDEKDGRLDIKYTKTSGAHVVVELKRAARVVSSTELIEQVSKYRNALKKLLKTVGREAEPVEVVCVVGRDLSDWSEERGRQESEEMLRPKQIRVVLYQALIENAYQAYKKYLDSADSAGRVVRLIKAIDDVDESGAGEAAATDA